MEPALEFCRDFLLWPAAALAVFAACFATIERFWPAVPRQPLWRRGTGADLALSFLNPIVVTPITSLVVTAAVNGVLGALGDDYLERARATTAAWPFAIQLIAALVVADFFAYWKHRLFHTALLWPIHAVHHSAEEVDWLTNERDHPLQLLATHLAVVIPLVLAGFSPAMITLQATLRRAYSLYTHCNVRWSYGPLDRVFVSPSVHRWHHAGDAEMAGKNFAVFFSFYDVLFGSFHMPERGRRPSSFGLPDRESLPGLAAMLRYPFRALGV